MASVVGEASSSTLPSTSIPPPRSCTYHVFLSFHGKDSRNGLTGHLHAALERKGIRTFIDNRDLEMGEVIKDELLKAIEESMFAITVLSPNYASSSWCLDELQHIVECSKNPDVRLSIVPVFYGVEPSDVRHQKGNFEEAFKKHEERFAQDTEKLKRWRDALAEVANLSGSDFKDKHEATLVESIAEHIHKNLIPKLPSSTKNLVGIASRVKEVMRHVGIGLNDVRFVGIRGMGGIGKTTIATAIFKEIQGEFKVNCFLANVRGARESNKIVDKQKQLLAKASINVNTSDNEHDIQTKIENFLRNKKVLLVLDDVSDEVELRSLAREQDWFGPGSRIIITTRDLQLLKECEVYETYEVQGLVDSESLDLFCLKAFKQKKLDEKYLDLAKDVVKYSGGLPLALEGSEAIQGIVLEEGRFKQHWSAEAFSNMAQLKLFILHTYWGNFQFHDHSSLPTSLKVLHWSFYPLKTLPLSDQQYELVDIRLECSSIENLCHGKKSLGKLKHLDLSWSDHLEQTPDLSEVPRLQTLVLQGCDSLTAVHSSVVHHKSLTLLDLTECTSLDALPGKLEMSSLKELILDECQNLKNLPEFGECMKRLSRLSLEKTSIKKLPTSLGCLVDLEHLNLRYCEGLECLPDTIDGMRLLRTLNLSYCYLTEESFPPDFGHFPSLTDLDLSGNDFVRIPISIHELPKLKCLKLNRCSKLQCLPELPSSVGELEAYDCDSLDISEFNILSKVCGVFVSPSQDPSHVLLEMVIDGSVIPSCFVHQQDGDSISIPCDHLRNERSGIALCFRVTLDAEDDRSVLGLCNGNNRFITQRTLDFGCYGDYLYIICLTKDCFSDGFHQGTFFELSILGSFLYTSPEKVSSATGWASKEDLEKSEIERPPKKKHKKMFDLNISSEEMEMEHTQLNLCI